MGFQTQELGPVSFDLDSGDAHPNAREAGKASAPASQPDALMVEIVCSADGGQHPTGGSGAVKTVGDGARSAQEASVLDQPLAISNMTVSTALGRLRRARSASKPTAMVGFKEWIFSHKAGALGLLRPQSTCLPRCCR